MGNKNQLIVIGTIHSQHLTSKKYSLKVFSDIIKNLNPDVILAEIPPDRFLIANEQFQKTGKINESRVSQYPEFSKVIFPLQKTLGFKLKPVSAWTEDMANDYNKGKKEHVTMAIDAALNARKQWANMSWEHRASIFLKAADLIAGKYRAKLNAATMLGQSKSVHQTEIDSVCESVDFLRFNVHFMSEIYKEQPESPDGVWNKLEWRPLEGFVFALTPFNFTSIACNLPTSAAMMGNVVVWKPSNAQIYSAKVLMDIYSLSLNHL